jgi:hypothetical protein
MSALLEIAAKLFPLFLQNVLVQAGGHHDVIEGRQVLVTQFRQIQDILKRKTAPFFAGAALLSPFIGRAHRVA